MTAVPYTADGPVREPFTVSWETVDPAVATVSSAGVVTGVGEGTTLLRASFGGLVVTRSITVHAIVAEVDVTGCAAPLQPGAQPCTLTATVRASSGSVIKGRAVSWSSDNPAIATVTGSGDVQPLAEGVAIITALVEGVSGSALVAVRIPIAKVSITGCEGGLELGFSCTVVAVARAADGSPLPGRTAQWASSNPAVATIDQSGLVSAVSAGTTTLTAQFDGGVGTLDLEVRLPVAAIEVTGCSVTLQVGGTCQLTATAMAADGSPLAGRTVVWTSEDVLVAAVDDSGQVTGNLEGEVLIKASIDGIERSQPVVVGGFASISAGGFHACGIKRTGLAYCWGWNSRGQLGDGTTTQRTTPVRAGMLNAMMGIAASEFHTCGWTQNAAAMCWGANDHGELGVGDFSDRVLPTPVSGLVNADEVATGQYHTCAVGGAGAVACWGANSSGQLGVGSGGPPVNAPTAVLGGPGLTRIAAGSYHTCGLDAAGSAYCWGSGSSGQLGNGDASPRSVPTPVADGHLFIAIVAGATHSCGLESNGSVWCWGWGGGNQWGIGDGTTMIRYTPVMVQGAPALSKISAYANHTCGITPAGVGYCWGRNDFGQLGDGTQTPRLSPVLVGGGHSFTDITTGAYFSCGVEATGAAWCWGNGGRGQLGDNTIRNWSLVPTQVLAP